jgi:hypothetical protein
MEAEALLREPRWLPDRPPLPGCLPWKVRIVLQEFNVIGAFRQLAQNQLDGDSRPSNHRFSHHDRRINRNFGPSSFSILGLS